MKNKCFFIIFLLLIIHTSSYSKLYKEKDIQELYSTMHLKNEISYVAFSQAFRGMAHIKSRRTNLLTIIDFSKPSNQERLYILDISRKKRVLSCHVAHGRGSGDLYATSFSNIEGTYKSSNGFFLTGASYYGKNGYSLRLHGLEPGRNDRAYSRTLVIHASHYASKEFGKQYGRLGRSLGCYTVPGYLNRDIINLLKDSNVLYVHSRNLRYSKYIFSKK